MTRKVCLLAATTARIDEVGSLLLLIEAEASVRDIITSYTSIEVWSSHQFMSPPFCEQ